MRAGGRTPRTLARARSWSGRPWWSAPRSWSVRWWWSGRPWWWGPRSWWSWSWSGPGPRRPGPRRAGGPAHPAAQSGVCAWGSPFGGYRGYRDDAARSEHPSGPGLGGNPHQAGDIKRLGRRPRKSAGPLGAGCPMTSEAERANAVSETGYSDGGGLSLTVRFPQDTRLLDEKV